MPIYRNWEDPSEYGFTENLSNKAWAWEFLRRNRDYQADFERELEIFIEREGQPPPIDNPIFALSPMHFEHRLDEWGINELFNPEQDNPRFLEFSRIWGKLIFKLERFESDKRILYAFDLSLPIKPQIEKAYKDLQARQKQMERTGQLQTRKPKLHKDKWPEYLRILDAKATGTRNNDTIASTLYPNDKNDYPEYPARTKVRKNYEAAKTLVDGGYKLIIAT